jgi:ribosomal-protein-alanine N-acetyltransferase
MSLPELVTPRPRLVPVGLHDLDRIHALLVLPEVRRFLCDDRVLPREVVAELLRSGISRQAEGLGLWSVLDPSGGWIGLLGLSPVEGAALEARPDFAGEVEPVVALHPAAQGRGYATEALRAALGHAFGTLRRDRLVALADVPNTASAAMLRRAGFVELGRAPGPLHELIAWECLAPTARASSSDGPAPAPSPPPPRNS